MLDHMRNYKVLRAAFKTSADLAKAKDALRSGPSLMVLSALVLHMELMR